ncbi:MAG: hypothetical protein O3A00_04100 [Planctomycetota bacterium]|nr:hypothetical protein [Planctomycetota bacterium]
MTTSAISDPGVPQLLSEAIETKWKTGELARLIAADAASWQETPTLLQNRKLHRRSFHDQLIIIPLESICMQPTGRPIVTRGRDISSGGIAFDHQTPIANRHVAIVLRTTDGGEITMLTCLNWCRFTREGTYYSGGRFIRQIDRPDGDVEWNDVSR